MGKIKDFFHKRKSALIKTAILLGITIGASLLVFLILFLTGIITFDGGFGFNNELFESFKGAWWGYLVFFLLQVTLTILLAFAPGGTTTFIALGIFLYGPTWVTFLLVFSGVLVSSLLMDLLGRFGGVKLVKKLFGEEDYNKGFGILREKGTAYLPFMYLFPIFPDDLMCCLGGMAKIKFWYHALIIFLCRGIGIAVIIFGIDIIPYETFTTPYEWIVAITVCLVWVALAFYFSRLLDKWLSKRFFKKKTEEKEQPQETKE